MNRLALRLTVIVTTTSMFIAGFAGGAAAATAPVDKADIIRSWTQATHASFSAWDAARRNQVAWAEYGFNWTTDYCTSSPDRPLGFDFRLPCQRHDWGYGNSRAVGRFGENKSQVDEAFYFDLLKVCDRYAAWQQPACDRLAWTYYQAVVAYATVAVAKADFDRAERTLQQGKIRHLAGQPVG